MSASVPRIPACTEVLGKKRKEAEGPAKTRVTCFTARLPARVQRR